MPYPNEHAARVRDPGDFEKGSFRSKTLPKGEDGKGGVRMIIGRLKGETTTTAQSYRFPADLYTPEEAKAWLKENDVKYIAFEQATGEKEAFEKWFDGLDEDVQELVEDHIHGLKSALIKERKARKDAERREKGFEEAGLWSEDVKELLRAALHDEAPPTSPRTYRYWIKDVSIEDSSFVYQDEEQGDLYQRTYSLAADGSVSMGPGMKVRVTSTYTPVGEAMGDEILGDVIPLVEKALAADGTIPIKLIRPGWGESGFYSPGLLERDGPQIFTAGTQMFWDHPTETEERERPERSLRDLAGELTEDAHWDPNGTYGPGLYARSKLFGGFSDAVDELAPHIGLSINAWGRAKEGEAEGREGKIIEEIKGARSVDFVTVPGAGGQILELFEAARKKPQSRENEESDMSDKELQEALKKEKDARQKLETENARLREVVLLGEAKTFVSGKLAEQEIPDLTKGRLIESLSKNPPVKEEKLDEEALDKKITEAVKGEMEYLSKVTGSGDIRGLGESGAQATEEDEEQLKESWTEHFIGKGFEREQAEIMAREAMRR